jgi:leucyl aminopeptidase (aminopeptidase T)
MGVKKGERVLVVSDSVRSDIGKPLFQAALEAGADASYMELEPQEMRGHEPPQAIADAMLDADVVLVAARVSLSHTEARVKANKNGTRIASMPYGSHPEQLVLEAFTKGGMAVDFIKMGRNIDRIADRLAGTSKARIVTDKGTDLTIEYGGREFHKDTGIAHKPGEGTNLPAGEVFVAPVSASGTAIIDVSMGRFDLSRSPLELTFDNGSVVSIGGDHAEGLEDLLEPFGDPARKIAEFAIGMNPKAMVSGIIVEDEKVAGTAHVAIGNNAGFGGDNNVELHMDGIIGDVTIYIDGEKLDLDEYTKDA